MLRLVLTTLSWQSLVDIQQVSNDHLQCAGTVLDVGYISDQRDNVSAFMELTFLWKKTYKCVRC